jgi:hypothetical protein
MEEIGKIEKEKGKRNKRPGGPICPAAKEAHGPARLNPKGYLLSLSSPTDTWTPPVRLSLSLFPSR